MKFLKALGIGIAMQFSVLLIVAFCMVSPGGASVILSLSLIHI